MDKTLDLFQNMYELLHEYNYFEYDDVIMFDYVNNDDKFETVKYNKTTNSIVSFVNN